MSDLATWALVDTFTVKQAACLWVGAKPSENIFLRAGAVTDQVAAIEQMLTTAIQSGVLDADTSTNALTIIGDHSATLVNREALRAFAESKNQRPDFLFDTLPPQDIEHGENEFDDADTHASERGTEPDGRKEHTPLKVSPEKPESGEKNKAVASPQAVPGLTKKSRKRKRGGGPKPGPYYSKLVKFMTLLHEKEFEKFQNGTRTELRDLVENRFRNDGVVGYPPSRSGLDDAITKAKQEVIDSADRI